MEQVVILLCWNKLHFHSIGISPFCYCAVKDFAYFYDFKK